MGRTACTEPQCLYKGALHLYLTVKLYLYSPYGPYVLYRASVPVQGCPLPLLPPEYKSRALSLHQPDQYEDIEMQGAHQYVTMDPVLK